MNQSPIFILGAHKSGTTLVRNLLNGHSKLYTIPFESHYFQYRKYWIDYTLRSRLPKHADNEEVIRSFVGFIHDRNTLYANMGGGEAVGQLDEALFKAHFSTIDIKKGDKQCIEKYFEAIYLAHTKQYLLDTIRIVEKSVTNAEFAIELAMHFPQAHFIHIIRNPYANLVSLRRYRTISNKYPNLSRLIKSLYNSYYYLYKNRRCISAYLVIRYEDLIAEPEQSMKKICEHLRLPFEQILLKPTELEKDWGGNSSYGEVFKGVNAQNASRWKDEINHLEIHYINNHFDFILRDFNYEPINTKRPFFIPVKHENISKWILNRVYHFL